MCVCMCGYTYSSFSLRYSIMQECWAADPENRPTFSTLSSILEQSLHTMADYLTLSQDLETAPMVARPSEMSLRYTDTPTLPRRQTTKDGYVDFIRETSLSRRRSDALSSVSSRDSNRCSIVIENEIARTSIREQKWEFEFDSDTDDSNST